MGEPKGRSSGGGEAKGRDPERGGGTGGMDGFIGTSGTDRDAREVFSELNSVH